MITKNNFKHWLKLILKLDINKTLNSKIIKFLKSYTKKDIDYVFGKDIDNRRISSDLFLFLVHTDLFIKDWR